MCISGLSNLIFHLLRGRVSGENCHFRLRLTTSTTHFDPHNTHSCVISVYGQQLPVHISIPTILIHVSFPSTVDNFRYTFRSPQYSFMCHFHLRSTTSATHFDPHNTHSCVISVYGRQLPLHISIPTILIHVSFPSTVDNFRYTFRSPQYSFMCHFRLQSTTSATHFDPHNTHSCVISVYGRQLPLHISIPTILIHVSFPSTVDNFWYTFRSPQCSFIASYDAKNELKRWNINSSSTCHQLDRKCSKRI